MFPKAKTRRYLVLSSSDRNSVIFTETWDLSLLKLTKLWTKFLSKFWRKLRKWMRLKKAQEWTGHLEESVNYEQSDLIVGSVSRCIERKWFFNRKNVALFSIPRLTSKSWTYFCPIEIKVFKDFYRLNPIQQS